MENIIEVECFLEHTGDRLIGKIDLGNLMINGHRENIVKHNRVLPTLSGAREASVNIDGAKAVFGIPCRFKENKPIAV